jgi:hypothetical protein
MALDLRPSSTTSLLAGSQKGLQPKPSQQGRWCLPRHSAFATGSTGVHVDKESCRAGAPLPLPGETYQGSSIRISILRLPLRYSDGVPCTV